MSEALVPVVDRREIARPGATSVALPEVIVDAGPAAVERFLEFFAAAIANDRTRAAYGQAAGRFLAWCGARGLGLRAIAPCRFPAPGSPVESCGSHTGSRPRRAHGSRELWQVLPVNPAAAVRGPKHVVTKGATPVLTPAERAAADAPGRAGHDQAPGVGGGAAGVDLLPHVSGDRHHGVTLANGGMLEHAQRIAGHASPKTTKFYDRTADTISRDEIERIVIEGKPGCAQPHRGRDDEDSAQSQGI